jgi:hypothetical protein
VVDETELISIIEGILTHIPLDDEEPVVEPVVNRHHNSFEPQLEEDYTIVNVRRMTSSPSPPLSPERLPTISEEQENEESSLFAQNKEERMQEEIAVQTSASFLALSPSPYRPTPPSSPRKDGTPPVLPQIIIQQHLPPHQEGERGIEKELVELLSTLVQTQQTTMQGQQALLLSVLQQQQQQMNIQTEETPDEIAEDVRDEKKVEENVEEKKESEEVKEVKEETVPILLEEVIQAESKVNYNTCFGEFLLGGKQLFGKYKVKEKLPFHQYDISKEITDGQEREDGRRDIIALPFEEPRTRRRANPLTMKLLFHNEKEEERKSQKVSAPPPSIDVHHQQQQFMEFANKLLDTVATRDRKDDKEEAWKKELSQAVHEGIALGLKQVLGYLPPSRKEKKFIKNNLGKPYYSRAVTGKADLKRLSFDRFEGDDKEENEEEVEGEATKHYHLPYIEESWQMKKKPQMKPQKRNENRKDDLKEFHIEMEKSQRNTYQLATGKGNNKKRSEENDEMASDGYNDSISLSEEYYAFYGDGDDQEGFHDSEGRRKGRKSSSPSSMHYMLESDDAASAPNEEERKEYTVNDIVGYDSNDEQEESSYPLEFSRKENKRGRDRLSVISDDDEEDNENLEERTTNKATAIRSLRVADKDLSDNDENEGTLLPLISAVLTQPATEKMVASSKQVHHRCNMRRGIEESDDDKGSPTSNEDEIHSLLSSQEKYEKLVKRKGRMMNRYSEDSEEDFSVVTEGVVVSSDEEYRHDHRRKKLLAAKKEMKGKHQLVLSKHDENTYSSTSSSSPSSSPSSSDKQDLSLSTADSSFEEVDGVMRHHHSNPSTYYQTRYSSSEIRMKRKGVLSSLNTKKRTPTSSLILPSADTREREVDSDGKADVVTREREVRCSISDDDERRNDRSYNSMLSSEESSIVSERLAILRKENHRVMKGRRERVLSNLNEEEKENYSNARLALDEQKGRLARPGSAASFSSSSASSNDFSVTTPSSSGSVAMSQSGKQRFDPYSRRKKLVNVSIPLLTVNDRKR